VVSCGHRSTNRDGADVSAPPKKSCTVPVLARAEGAGGLVLPDAGDTLVSLASLSLARTTTEDVDC